MRQESMPVKKLLGKLSDWVQQSYVDVNVWKDISEFVSQEALNSYKSSPATTQDGESVLIENQTDRFLSHVSEYVYPSELKEFAVKRLGLRETEYEMIVEDHIYAKRRNFEVNVESSLVISNDNSSKIFL